MTLGGFSDFGPIEFEQIQLFPYKKQYNMEIRKNIFQTMRYHKALYLVGYWDVNQESLLSKDLGRLSYKSAHIEGIS